MGSAQQIEVGKVNNGVFELSENSEQLVKAIEWTFRDGTKVVELKIEQLQNAYFLVATCTYQNRKRLAAIDLDMEGSSFIVKEDAFFKTCSAEFITPLTLATLSKNPVHSQFVKNEQGEWTNHVDLALWADIMLIAPATANTLSKMANGICDNLLLATYLSAKCPIWFAPAIG